MKIPRPHEQRKEDAREGRITQNQDDRIVIYLATLLVLHCMPCPLTSFSPSYSHSEVRGPRQSQYPAPCRNMLIISHISPPYFRSLIPSTSFDEFHKKEIGIFILATWHRRRKRSQQQHEEEWRDTGTGSKGTRSAIEWRFTVSRRLLPLVISSGN